MTIKQKERNKHGTIIQKLNPLQMVAAKANENFPGHKAQKYITIEAGRGTGKSTILAWFIAKACKTMPGAIVILVGANFVQILTRTFLSTKQGLKMFGIYEDIDYVVGKCGKDRGFKMPEVQPNSWRNAIHFSCGLVILMVSLDVKDSGRGLNSHAVIGDEALTFDQERLSDNVQKTNRGGNIWSKVPEMLNAEILVSSTPMTKAGQWFVKREDISIKNPKDYCFLKANAMVNAENLPKDYFTKALADSKSQLHYDAEIMNIRVPQVTDGFYAQLRPEIHYYKHKYNVDYLYDIGFSEYKESQHYNCNHDGDLMISAPLELTVDFGSRINCALVSQPNPLTNEHRFLKEFFVKHSLDYIDLMRNFSDYYKPKQSFNRTINLYHDTAGFHEKRKRSAAETYSDEIIKFLRGEGWRVVLKVSKKDTNPLHNDKFLVINNILKRREQRIPRILINSDNCPNLIISMENAEIEIKARDDYRKDKSSERSKELAQEKATHLSDCFDYNVYWKYSYLVLSDGHTRRKSFWI